MTDPSDLSAAKARAFESIWTTPVKEEATVELLPP